MTSARGNGRRSGIHAAYPSRAATETDNRHRKDQETNSVAPGQREDREVAAGAKHKRLQTARRMKKK